MCVATYGILVSTAPGGPRIIAESEAKRMFVTDEKGLSQRSDAVLKGVVPSDLKSHAAGQEPNLTWSHISILSFISLDPTVQLPVGLIAPLAKTNKTMEEAAPGCIVAASSTGSMTAAIFPVMLETCFLKPVREQIPMDEPLVILMDSSGGSWLHISIEAVLLMHRYNCHAYILPACSTKALCALDQNPHAAMSAKWRSFKQQWAQTHGSLNLYQALSAASHIAAYGLSQDQVSAGWSRVGYTPNQQPNRNIVLVERSNEVFTSLTALEKGQELEAISPHGKGTLDLVARLSPAKIACSSCKSKITVVDKFCRECGRANEKFQSDLL